MKPQHYQILMIAMAVALFLCLLKLPYGYYQFVRLFATFGFVLLAIRFSKIEEQKIIFYSSIFLAILFQPIIKITLGRFLWNVVDVIIGIYLLILSLKD